MAGSLDGKRIAIVATDGFEQSELMSPKNALERRGAKVDVIAPHGGWIRGWHHTNWGEEVKVDRVLDDVKAEDAEKYDGLLLPGGVMNPDQLRLDERVLALVQRFFEEDIPVAAICHAAWTLIDAGVVRATPHELAQPAVRSAQRGRPLGRPTGDHRRQPDHQPEARRPPRVSGRPDRRAGVAAQAAPAPPSRLKRARGLSG